MKEQKISNALEESLALMEQGKATLEECLARYPQHAAELRPLLTTVQEMRRVSLPSPSPAATSHWRQRTVDALAAQKPNRRPAAPFSRRLARVGKDFQAILRRRPRAVALVVLFAILLAVGLSLYPLGGTPTIQAATLTSVQGVVEILPAGGDAWLPYSTGQRVAPGDRIRVGRSSSATLAFPNGGTTDLESGTDVDLVRLSTHGYGRDRWDVVLHQRAGRTINCLHCSGSETYRFEVRTQFATVVARSTQFSVRVGEDGVIDVAVVEGVVAVTASDTSLRLEAGQMTSIRPEQPPASVLPIPTSVQEPTATVAPTREVEEIETPEPTELPLSIETDDDEQHETPEPMDDDEDDTHEEHETPTPTPEPAEHNGDDEDNEDDGGDEDDRDDDHEERETPDSTTTDEPEEDHTPTPEASD